MIGAALVRRSGVDGHASLVGVEGQPDWTDGRAVDRFFAKTRPDQVIVAAGRTEGIGGNQQHPADLMLDNLLVAAHVIPAAWRYGARKLMDLASSCTYPMAASQPWKTDAIGTGATEPTSAASAAAKLAGITLCEAYSQQHGAHYIAAVVADVFGPGDAFGSDGHGHVVSDLMSRMHEGRVTGAKSMTVWGSGIPRREFIYIDDLADAALFLMRAYEDQAPINIGTGVTTSIRELAETMREVGGFRGDLVFDPGRPDGAPVKSLDTAPLRALGWVPSWELRAALESTYEWFLACEACQAR